MRQKTSQNSLLLLTTLGVYLGLLVAGAAPGVVAQQAAAMTRNFELSEEVEVKDDLDKKPNGDVSESEQDVDLAALEVIVASYLERVIDASVLPLGVPHTSLPEKPLVSQLPPLVPIGYSPYDVRRSPSFAYQHFPRAGLDPLLAPRA